MRSSRGLRSSSRVRLQPDRHAKFVRSAAITLVMMLAAAPAAAQVTSLGATNVGPAPAGFNSVVAYDEARKH